MSANQLQMPAGASEIAVSEAKEQVSAKARDLLNQRKQLNRRILRLSEMIKGLTEFATNATSVSCESAPKARAYATGLTRPRNGAIPSGRTNEEMGFSSPGRTRHPRPALTRACRIALLEAGGTASPDEIRRLIVRRGSFSFSFAAHGSADAVIVRTLELMVRSGEARRIKPLSQSLWQLNGAGVREQDLM
jgi:hypothetical protein